MSTPEYSAPAPQVSSDDLAAFLIPDSPAGIPTPTPAPAPVPAPPATPGPTHEQLLAAWQQQDQAAAPTPPVVPGWVWRVSARAALLAVAVGLVAFLVWGIAAALSAAAAALAAAAPVLLGAAAALGALVLLCRRSTRTDSVSVTQTVQIHRRK